MIKMMTSKLINEQVVPIQQKHITYNINISLLTIKKPDFKKDLDEMFSKTLSKNEQAAISRLLGETELLEINVVKQNHLFKIDNITN